MPDPDDRLRAFAIDRANRFVRKYVHGLDRPGDGEIEFALAANLETSRIVFGFPVPIDRLSLDYHQAVELAERLLTKARQVREAARPGRRQSDG